MSDVPDTFGGMRLIHTSDWHVGRTFHRHRTIEHLESVLTGLADLVREHDVDAVLVAGDLFDLSMPAAEHFDVLDRAFSRIRDAGAVIVATPGNHDSASRLGFQSTWAAKAGVHVIAKWPSEPVVLHDDHGPVHLFGVPYLEPSALRVQHPRLAEQGVDVSTADGAVSWAMGQIREALHDSPARSVVLAHCFVGRTSTGDEVVDDAPKDITVGGQSLVSASHFDGIDYTALGHIHSRQRITESVRYSGAPLYYSFKESSPHRGVWLVDLDDAGLADVTWLDLPIPRRTRTIRGELESLLADASLDGTEDEWIRAILTDAQRPADPMSRLQKRWPNCSTLQFEPPEHERESRTYRERVAGRRDIDVVAEFAGDVRENEPLTELERSIVEAALISVAAEEAAR